MQRVCDGGVGKGELKGSQLALPVSFSFKIPTPAQGGNRPASVKAKSQLRLHEGGTPGTGC